MAKVLLIDDDRLAHKLVARVLEKAGHETLAAYSSREAWDRIQEHVLVDMVILDNQLGSEWGWQFLRTLRNSPAFRGIPVVVYTAHTERESLIRYMEMGVQTVRVKPRGLEGFFHRDKDAKD
jgi:CheY-like chemotaxis protein